MLSNGSDEALQQITNTLFNALYNKPYELPKERIEIKLPVETLNQYVGEYEIRPDLHVIMSVKNGELTALPTGQRENILHAEKEDFFFVKEQDIQVEFTRNEQKQITGFALHQNGRKTSCKKIK